MQIYSEIYNEISIQLHSWGQKVSRSPGGPALPWGNLYNNDSRSERIRRRDGEKATIFRCKGFDFMYRISVVVFYSNYIDHKAIARIQLATVL